MSIDFSDPTTWDKTLTETDAINMAIFALNTIQEPDASTDSQFTALDFFSDGVVETLFKLRERLEAEAWVVETQYNTDFDGREIDPAKEEYPRTLHGPFTEAGAEQWMDDYPDGDTDIHEMIRFPLNRPESIRP